jgi:hypothetical protein
MMRTKLLDQFREGIAQLVGKEYEVTDLRAEIEGVTFVGLGSATPGASLEICVEFECKACGGLQQQHVRSLADIGAILSGAGEPHENCPARARADSGSVELSPGDKLIEAFRNFLASELEQV